MNTTDRDRREALEARIQQEECVCGKHLVLTWINGDYHLRCGSCGPDPDTRPNPHRSLRQRFRRGERLTALEQQILRQQLYQEVNRAKSEGVEPRPATLRLYQQVRAVMTGQALTPIEGKYILRQLDAERYVDAAKLFNQQVSREVAIAYLRRTGLNPLANEVCIYEGKLYPMVDGLRHLALREGVFDGSDPPQFLSTEEKKAHGYLEHELVCQITLYRKGISRGFVGTGKANRDQPYRNNAVEKEFAPRMAENRAYRHAWRQGFQDLLSEYNIEVPPDSIDEPTTASSEESPLPSLETAKTEASTLTPLERFDAAYDQCKSYEDLTKIHTDMTQYVFSPSDRAHFIERDNQVRADLKLPASQRHPTTAPLPMQQ